MQFKVLSLNLWNGGRLFEQMEAFLKQEQADIMLLQEAYNGQNPGFEPRFRTVSRLKQAFPEYDVAFAPAYLDTRQKEGRIDDGQVIFSRWPLSDPDNLFFDIPYGEYDQDTHADFSEFPANLQTAVTTIDGRSVKLLNVHGPVNYDGLADTDRRLRMRDVIVAEIRTHDHVILAGDFNVRPQTETMRSIAQSLTPVFAAGELPTTFNMQQKKNPGFAIAAVDNIFVSPRFGILSKDCPVVNVSDHLPLVANLEL